MTRILHSLFSDRKAAAVKSRLDHFLPLVLLLLALLVVFQFMFAVTPELQQWVNVANWSVAGYFAIRLAVDYKLHDPGEQFWRNHWLDILMVIPLFSLIQEARIIRLAEESLIASVGEEMVATSAIRNTKVAAEVTRIVRILRRSIRL